MQFALAWDGTRLRTDGSSMGSIRAVPNGQYRLVRLLKALGDGRNPVQS
jgi:hypothetical protein